MRITRGVLPMQTFVQIFGSSYQSICIFSSWDRPEELSN